ncbi:hypothetical protein M2352_003332 [Azospirillum fermentarium]|uniref:hypothetical protein n=1 Tax=Azospirillum fermentarium TaxID=1233114 RepID=UPI002225D35A|nr:hypothetical protein [Azospirillum fermentarium]MCW2247698.1 hypothetical protein [Azospirillum fermentarium]
MTAFDHCLQRIAHLDRADRLLNEVRLYDSRMPLREALRQQQQMLSEARRHLESARTLPPAP